MIRLDNLDVRQTAVIRLYPAVILNWEKSTRGWEGTAGGGGGGGAWCEDEMMKMASQVTPADNTCRCRPTESNVRDARSSHGTS